MNKNYLQLLTVFLLFVGCQQENTDKSLIQLIDSVEMVSNSKIIRLNDRIDSTSKITTAQQKVIDSLTSKIQLYFSSDSSCFEDPNTEEIKIINHIFYHSVIKGRSTPMARKKNGYAHLLLDRFIEGLKRHDIFDSTFIASQRTEFQQCAKDIEDMKFEGDMDLGWEPSSCTFFNYYYYIGGQEPPQYYESAEITINESNASAKIRYFDVYQKKKQFWKRHLKLDYVRKNDAWKILKATLTDE